MTKARENRLVVAPGGWAETIPDWLKKEVEFERLTLGLAGNIAELRGQPIREVGDAEACLYLYTLSLSAPMGYHLGQAYIYLTAKLTKRRNPSTVPDFAEKKLKAGLTPDEQRELTELKRELYRARGGEIHSPLLDAMRQLGKDIKRGKPRVRSITASTPACPAGSSGSTPDASAKSAGRR